MSLDEKIPRIIFPEKSGRYKVVQLDLDGQSLLRFSEENWETHAIILMKLFRELDIKYNKIISRSDCDVPALQGDKYEVYGMGNSMVSVEEKVASFYGSSFDYGVKMDAGHLDSMKKLAQDWRFELR